MGTAPLPTGGFSAHLLLEVLIFPRQACPAVPALPAGNPREPPSLSSSQPRGQAACAGLRVGRGRPPAALPAAACQAAASKLPSADSSLEVMKVNSGKSLPLCM